MMTSSELRTEARNNLSNKWGEAILVALIYFAVTIALNMISQFIPGASLLLLIVNVPFGYGVIVSFLKLKRNDNFSYGDIFTEAFKNFVKIWAVVGNQLLKLIIPIILVVVSIVIMTIGIVIVAIASNSSSDSSVFLSILSILFMLVGLIAYIASLVYLLVKSYYYSLSYYLLYDNPNMSGKEIVNLSESIMKGQRWNFFCLQFSFIGWTILAVITCGIGLLFLQPYIEFATIAFYEDRIGKLANTNNN